MGRSMRHHTDLHLGRPATRATTLAAIDTRHTVLVHELAPGAVGKNHQLGDDLVERCTALAAHDTDNLVVHIKIEIDAVILLRPQAKAFAFLHPALLQHLGPLPKLGDL